MECRAGCGACCIAPSISSPIPGLPNGKAAGERCPHLTAEFLCAIFGRSERPSVCSGFAAAEYVCGSSREEAIRLIGWLEQVTA
ncbi:YkgJ family cysteine cluster protein [Aquipseudomonas alcaligenes]|uniref:YkgJ family cysteine cluster protein n=1 Tax=Aquipseudomonas alcaligenes TaxID=43263 RepID=UPI001F227968|nr:YkgJ family cysteine cluster protein [Pseudomonas alcaligenes]